MAGNSQSVSHSVMSASLKIHGLQPARLLCPWDSPGKNSGVGRHVLLQGLLLTQGSNLRLLHCRWILRPLSHLGSPYVKESLMTNDLVKLVLIVVAEEQFILPQYMENKERFGEVRTIRG